MDRRNATLRRGMLPGACRLTPAILAGLLASATCANAQEAEASGSEIPEDGTIIVSRDVHHTIGAPYFPGQTHRVVTAPGRLVVSTLDNGLKPLTDGETAQVTAQLTSPQMQNGALAEMGQTVELAGGGSQLASGTQVGSVVTSTIDRSMDALDGALGSLSALAGGGQ
ncbi:hypothetical protein [Alteraurantiacibacter aquimixticola]|uniref:Uncharacterized protein n=1 Tax=Alteraurantiacibacter aquimixticola TaxID=2489173 RepID=A0A4T3F2X1_9SPHN|nr:hypothetical protein [Alteraurantiacibacter aquimixticola]TIX51553.1 hypothetical protein E5222_03615 [Alteraurantiacibacter aquimixticola]